MFVPSTPVPLPKNQSLYSELNNTGWCKTVFGFSVSTEVRMVCYWSMVQICVSKLNTV